MIRKSIVIALIAVLSIVAVLGWFGVHLKREIKEIEIGYQGEAKTNTLLAARRFAKRMGMPSETLPSLLQVDRLPAAGDILLIGTARASFVPEQHQRLLDWVTRGGHLILAPRKTKLRTKQIIIDDDLLKRMGIAVVADGSTEPKQHNHPFLKIYLPHTEAPLHVQFNPHLSLQILDVRPELILEDMQGIRLIHARHGSGRVTALSDLGFLHNDHIGELDHAEFLYHLLHLGGDPGKLWLVHDEDMPPLWKWLWQHAWSLIISLITLCAAWLKAKMTRFGPLLPVTTRKRRRLLEHIDASGHFLWNQGQQRHLINSVQSALERRLLTHHPGWPTLRACAKIHPRLRLPQNVSGGVAGPPISGHVDPATLPDIGTPAPCQTRPGASSFRAEIYSQALSPKQRETILPKINRLSKQHIHSLLHAPAPDDAQSFIRRIKLLENIRRTL